MSVTKERVYWCVSCPVNIQLRIISLLDGTLLNSIVYDCKSDYKSNHGREPTLNEPLVLDNDCVLLVDHEGNLVAFDCANVATTPTAAFLIDLGSGNLT